MVREDAGTKPGDTQAEESPPPLPPRPSADLTSTAPVTRERPNLQSRPTTAISSMSIQTVSFPDGSRGTFTSDSKIDGPSEHVPQPSGYDSPKQGAGSPMGDIDESMSVMSLVPTLRPPGDLQSLMVGELNQQSAAWKLLRSQSANVEPFESVKLDGGSTLAAFPEEFDELPGEGSTAFTDEDRMAMWKCKLKHYMILSSAGKPIYSRHGDLGLINSSMGVVQTIISFYEGAKNPLQGFTAGNTRFVIVTEGPLYFVAVSKLGESDSQLRAQLDALYMQILSTLTLPGLTNIFANRPSTDLRKPLQGTESLLSSLADSFTKGSPSAMLGALECLKMRKSHRHTINNAFLKCRADKLLYGLIVAGGKLVSVIRPRRHSLHPSDLQLIFNMLFESEGIRAGGGENWIPLCLPAFNNKGYLHMYVSFFDGELGDQTTPGEAPSTEEEIAIILVSPDKESFFALKQMRDDVVDALKKKGCLGLIKAAARQGRPKVTAIAPGLQISHFLFKSRANVQFFMPSLDPIFSDMVARRRLMTLYHNLHASVHAKHSHLKVLHCASEESTSLSWITPIFEFYCVAGPNASRAIMTQGANKIIQWAKREEERLFIIGGGVF